MSDFKPKSFWAPLERTGTSLNWVIARVPADLKKAWPGWRNRRVRGRLNGFEFRTSLFPGSGGVGHTLLVNKKMQAGAKVRPGDRVKIQLEPDLDERPFEMPDELEAVLKEDRRMRNWFGALSPSMRKGLANWVTEPRGAATRRTRAERLAERLMLAMEGELEPPPILRAAFQRQPLARTGWLAMTRTQRRNHLLGIFYYQTAEARERRASLAMEEALRVAQRQTRNKSRSE